MSDYKLKKVIETSGEDNEDTLDIALPCTGAIDESLVLKNVNQIAINKKKSSYKLFYHFIEGTFLSPDFKSSLVQLAKLHKFKYAFINLQWPSSLFKDYD